MLETMSKNEFLEHTVQGAVEVSRRNNGRAALISFIIIIVIMMVWVCLTVNRHQEVGFVGLLVLVICSSIAGCTAAFPEALDKDSVDSRVFGSSTSYSNYIQEVENSIILENCEILGEYLYDTETDQYINAKTGELWSHTDVAVDIVEGAKSLNSDSLILSPTGEYLNIYSTTLGRWIRLDHYINRFMDNWRTTSTKEELEKAIDYTTFWTRIGQQEGYSILSA